MKKSIFLTLICLFAVTWKSQAMDPLPPPAPTPPSGSPTICVVRRTDTSSRRFHEEIARQLREQGHIDLTLAQAKASAAAQSSTSSQNNDTTSLIGSLAATQPLESDDEGDCNCLTHEHCNHSQAQ